VSPFAEARPAGIRRFRTKLFVAMMLVVSALTSLGIYVAQRRAATDAQVDLQRDFELELASLHRLQDLRNAAVDDRSTALARNARIHAALEDNALDLLYPSAQEELRDLMERPLSGNEEPADALQARFYRFLDSRGAVIVPPTRDAGNLLPNEQAQLAQNGVPQTMQTGYLTRQDKTDRPTIDEMIAVPIRSTETNDVIAALVLGFKPVEVIAHSSGSTGMKSGILVDGKLELPAFDRAVEEQIVREVERDVAQADDKEHSLETEIGGVPHLLFFKRLNLHSNYPPAYEVCVYPLTQLLARQRQLRSQFLTAGGLLLLGGFLVSHFFSRRLSQPVEKLAVVAEENLAQRRRAEAELKTTAQELQRSARFSADASHQLKSPITVLRAGLDSLLARDGFPREVYEEISSLIHQTYRLTGVVEDLLLLSRMDAGKLRLNLHDVDLAHLVTEWLDDLRAMPEAADLRVETDIPDNLQVAGETKFTSLIVQNLLDNARKYNRPGGIIRISAREANKQVELRVANTGRGIPTDEQPFVFERFHRAGAGTDVPGHGLGLNLARELVRLHGGELRLIRSNAEWTEFSALFCTPVPAARPTDIAS
jgi:signal transduction histidine kinase